jgi:hypothetical protein
LLVSYRKGLCVQDSIIDEVVFEIETELGWADHTHSDESVDCYIVADGNFEGGGMSLLAHMMHAVFDNCRKSSN